MQPFHAPGGSGEILARYSFLEPLVAGRRVLEVGAVASTGGLTALALAERGASAVLSLDSDEDAIATASRASGHPFVQFRSASTAAELKAGTFDLVVVQDGAALAASPDRVAELARLLSPRGHLATSLPAPGAPTLAGLAGLDGPAEAPTYESFVGALQAVFPVVEVATQAVAVGWVVAAVGDAAPELAVDGGFGGAPEAAHYLAVCGHAPSGLRGMCLVTLPVGPVAQAAGELRASAEKARDDAAVERDRAAAVAERGAAAEAARDAACAEAAELRSALEAVRRELAGARAASEQSALAAEQARAALEEVLEARDGLTAELEGARSAADAARAEAASARAAADAAQDVAGTARGEAEALAVRGETSARRAERAEARLAELGAERDRVLERVRELEKALAAEREAARAERETAAALRAALADACRERDDARSAGLEKDAAAGRQAEALVRHEQRIAELEALARSQVADLEIAHREAARALAEAAEARARADEARFDADAARARARGAEEELRRAAADFASSRRDGGAAGS
jgi:SAM-dependent methyltransferase